MCLTLQMLPQDRALCPHHRRLPRTALGPLAGALFYALPQVHGILGEANLSLGIQDKGTGPKWKNCELRIIWTQRGKGRIEAVTFGPSPPLEEEVEEFCILGWTKVTPKAKWLRGKGPRRPPFQLPSLVPKCLGHFQAIWV